MNLKKTVSFLSHTHVNIIFIYIILKKKKNVIIFVFILFQYNNNIQITLTIHKVEQKNQQSNFHYYKTLIQYWICCGYT